MEYSSYFAIEKYLSLLSVQAVTCLLVIFILKFVPGVRFDGTCHLQEPFPSAPIEALLEIVLINVPLGDG